MWLNSVHATQFGEWVGGAWSNFDFVSNFVASSYDKSSLHELLCLFVCFYFSDVLGRTRLKLVGGWMKLGPSKIYKVIFGEIS